MAIRGQFVSLLIGLAVATPIAAQQTIEQRVQQLEQRLDDLSRQMTEVRTQIDQLKVQQPPPAATCLRVGTPATPLGTCCWVIPARPAIASDGRRGMQGCGTSARIFRTTGEPPIS